MPPEVQDEVKTEEVATSGEPSAQEQATTAKEADKTSGDGPAHKGETSQEKTASEGESDDSKLPFNNHPRWKEIYGENKEMKQFVSELKEAGIESKDHAEALVRDADNFHFIVDQLNGKPEEFFEDVQKAFPKAYETHILRKYDQLLEAWADAFRRQGDSDGTTKAEVFEEVRKTLNGSPSRRSVSQRNAPDQDRESLDKEKWELFEDQVVSERNSRITEKINELLPKGIEFRSPKQREKFVSNVIEDVLDSLGNDKVFVRELGYAENPRRGLGKSQRQEAVQVWMKFAFLNDSRRLRAAIAEQASLMNLAGTATGNGGAKQVERREATGQGAPASGALTVDERARIRAEIDKQGLSGTKPMEAYMAAIRKRMLGSP